MEISTFAAYNAREFWQALDDGRWYPDAWIHLATWWRITGTCPEWPARPSDERTQTGRVW